MLVAKVIVAIAACLSGLGVVFSPQAVHSALFLTCNLLCVAVLYLLMSMHFLGAAQLLVYAGAIMVVFLFAVTVLAPEDEMTGSKSQRNSGIVVASVLGGTLTAVASTANLGSSVQPFGGSVPEFAAALFGRYVFPFEATAFVLLVALIGVVLLGHRRLKELDRGGPSRD